jgi:hypothetical protein
MSIEDLQPDNSMSDAVGAPLSKYARNPHQSVDVEHGGGGGGGGGGSSIDYTALITAIKNSVEAIDGDTDALAGILLAVDTLESIGTTGNATTAQILNAVSSILTQAQATNANTDQLEALLTSLQTTLQTESDQTQVGLSEIKAAVEAIPLGAEYLQLVDYVEGGQVIGTNGVTVLELSDLLPVSISGATPPWTPPKNYGATDGVTTWKLVGQLQTVAGQRYNLNSSISFAPDAKYIFGNQIIDMANPLYDDIEVVGDGSIIEVGYLFPPNTPSGVINQFSLTTLPSLSVRSCTDFVRKIVGGVATDYELDGLAPYTVQGVIKTECPALFLQGRETTSSVKSFSGYKTLEIVILDGQAQISDGLNTVTYPQIGTNQTVLGVKYDGGLTLSNTITVLPIGTATYTWSGVL